jgi:hypothetical protein
MRGVEEIEGLDRELPDADRADHRPVTQADRQPIAQPPLPAPAPDEGPHRRLGPGFGDDIEHSRDAGRGGDALQIGPVGIGKRPQPRHAKPARGDFGRGWQAAHVSVFR